MVRVEEAAAYVVVSTTIWFCMPVLEAVCTDRDVKFALQRCNPQLSAISTAILRSVKDYRPICSAFSAYIRCVEPQVKGCTSIMLNQYQTNRRAYSRARYNCSTTYLHDDTPNYNVNSTKSSGQAALNSPQSTLWIASLVLAEISITLVLSAI